MPERAKCGLGVIVQWSNGTLPPRGLAVEVLVTTGEQKRPMAMVTWGARAVALRQSWEQRQQMEEGRQVVQVKVSGFNRRRREPVNLEGLRAFIPRSHCCGASRTNELVGQFRALLSLEGQPRRPANWWLSEKACTNGGSLSGNWRWGSVEGHVVAGQALWPVVNLGGVSGPPPRLCTVSFRHRREPEGGWARCLAMPTASRH